MLTAATLAVKEFLHVEAARSKRWWLFGQSAPVRRFETRLSAVLQNPLALLRRPSSGFCNAMFRVLEKDNLPVLRGSFNREMVDGIHDALSMCGLLFNSDSTAWFDRRSGQSATRAG